MFANPVTGILAACMFLALWFVTETGLKKQNKLLVRGGVSGLVSVVTAGWLWSRLPAVLFYDSGNGARGLSLQGWQAPDATLQQLWYALVLGILIVMPALLFLMRTFKKT